MYRAFRLEELKKPLSASGLGDDAQFDRVSTDTRNLQQGDLFVALSGPNFDGNRFVAQARDLGAVAAIVSEFQQVDIPQLKVADTRIALGQISALNRQLYTNPLVAITGSSGKTSVKEMLASILRTQGDVLATKGNLNNEIGVPLTLLELKSQHRFGVIELGASGLGEIAYTVSLAEPDVAILNNAGGAHLEGFGDLNGVVKAKGEIFEGLTSDGTGVVNLDDPSASIWLAQLRDKKHLTFSLLSAHADLFASHIEEAVNGCYGYVLNSHEGSVQIQLQVLGRHMIANAMAAAAAAIALGIDLQQIKTGLEQFQAVPGRLVASTTSAGTRVIDDTYNANPDSMKAAIDVLGDLSGTRILVMGNMGELGSEAVNLHREIGDYAATQGIELLLAVGELASVAATAFNTKGGESRVFENNQALATWLNKRVNEEMVVLIKGSRSAAMETVVEALLTAPLTVESSAVESQSVVNKNTEGNC
ncbi:UDP-N-acetylmuramoyl-tripeptide--D-alanyl-D-alanine ligase [Motiliproteus sp. MSK22-1]|uniref:UDP-N-acetylmuramoyl-tripeptide--D-alanyl-D- alanine ligase n=1 Tax=Motiliproteus sp. MSK22-1 TaxID=1897630 RepID=UPI0009765422|nr:UDP-N-acetylmuramoyl-tripeptide--D-alanyl-D-alanine ligase [Motiliproteus sp. MSK22-1]OMH36550.1 hypothetical protein BGP75_09345 [Motiliproteus sp. MSK22-1]